MNNLSRITTTTEPTYIEKTYSLKDQINQYYRSIIFISLGSKEGWWLKRKWQEHLNTFGRVRWILKYRVSPDSTKFRYNLIVEYPSKTDGVHLISTWMTDLNPE